MEKNKILEYIYRKKYYLSLLGCLCIIAIGLYVTSGKKEDYGDIADLNEKVEEDGTVDNTLTNGLVDNESLENTDVTIAEANNESENYFLNGAIVVNEDRTEINEQIAEEMEENFGEENFGQENFEEENAVEIFAASEDNVLADQNGLALDGEALATANLGEEIEQGEQEVLGEQGEGDQETEDGKLLEQGDVAGQEAVAEPEVEQQLMPIITVEQPDITFELEDGIISPLDGEILMPFNNITPIYFKTLEQYRINNGLFIKATIGDEVKAVANGIVEKIEYIDDKGYVITIYHGNGYKSRYGQLSEVMNVSEGEVVKAGWVIGYVEEVTNYYLLEGTHLYFEFIENEEPINPLEVINE
jgi:murein DD-endopeptidase MepM/ murein hydrolase activator NlpD